ncbi:hypothetical protein [Haloarchaeobius sp. DFWS5]|uniref:hypothetical protein n=1 Tax=Haloarchaeobius sp. DFWS5 TaxID=3446114 RepID=UPI003EB7179C
MTTKNSTKLSRRQVLAGLGTIGVASAGAGLGTTAFFSDTERLQGWYEAGRVDLILDYRSTYNPWERYDLQMVPEDERPAIVKGTGGMTYEIGAAPAIRYVESGEALSHEEWGRLVTGATDVPVACDFEDPTDISSALPDRFETLSGGTYLPGYVDGQDNGDASQTAMFVDLVDIKPHDSGETTFSFHLCGNPSYLYVELIEDETHSEEDYREGVTTPTEPEREAGEPAEQTGAFEGGELCDYLYVVVSPDPDCDNRTDSELLGPEDDDDGDDIAPVYAGSMSGWIELIRNSPDGKLTIPPVNGAAGDPIVYENCFEPGVHCYAMEWYLPCRNEETEDGKYGFADLPVFNNPEIGAGTFAEELISRGYEDGDSGVPLNANITQTDTCHVGLQFTAEQCRHNPECNEAGIDISTGVADWEVVSVPAGETAGPAQNISTHPAWVDAPVNSFGAQTSWINHAGGSGQSSYEAEDYVYETNFAVSPANVDGTCVLDFEWSSDNKGAVEFDLLKLNNDFSTEQVAAYTDNDRQYQVLSGPEQYALTEPGQYKLRVTVRNNEPDDGPSPTGLLLSGGVTCECAEVQIQ